MIPLEMEIQELAPESPYIWRAKRPKATRRLICFPHAGAGAAAYADWAALLPADMELVAVQLPGRQNRIAEDPFTEVGPLVNVLTHALRPVFDLPFAFFGHSGGATLAFELARALRDRGARGPEQLFLSAQPAPGACAIRQLHQLSDEDFYAEIVALGGVDEELVENEDAMEAMLWVLRADFTLWERHRLEPGTPLDTPITALCGDADPRAPRAEVMRWREQTTGAFTAEVYPGGHFYFIEDPAPVVSFIVGRMPAPAAAGRTA